MEKVDKAYKDYLDSVRIKVPEGLEEETLSVIEQKESARRMIIVRLSSVAAIILVLISTVFLFPGKSSKMDYAEKLAVMVEAHNMFPATETEQPDKEILYEDELLIIYTK